MTPHIQVLTTIDSSEEADNISQRLVDDRLAACVQILGPIRSRYWWKKEVEETEEWICLIKTRRELYSKVESAIKEVHPYSVPEILALPVEDGNPDYLRWLDSEVRG